MLIEFIKGVGKRDKMRDLPSILSLFRNEFNRFNNTGARWSIVFIEGSQVIILF